MLEPSVGPRRSRSHPEPCVDLDRRSSPRTSRANHSSRLRPPAPPPRPSLPPHLEVFTGAPNEVREAREHQACLGRSVKLTSSRLVNSRPESAPILAPRTGELRLSLQQNESFSNAAG